MRVEVVDQRAVHEERQTHGQYESEWTVRPASRAEVRTMGCTRTWFLGAMASVRVESGQRSRDEVKREARRRCNEREGATAVDYPRLWQCSRIRRTWRYRDAGGETAVELALACSLANLAASSHGDQGKGPLYARNLGAKMLLPPASLDSIHDLAPSSTLLLSRLVLQAVISFSSTLQQPSLTADTTICAQSELRGCALSGSRWTTPCFVVCTARSITTRGRRGS